MFLDRQLERIKSKFENLKILDTDFCIPGAQEHQYRLNPPAEERIVAALEKKYGVRLPIDYRYFITQFANGGAGAYYGLFTVEKAFADYLTPKLPFPYQTGNRVQYAENQTSEDLERLCAFYDDPANEYGKIVIGEIGCGIMLDLIVTGQARGQIWIDDRTFEWGGLYPFDLFDNTESLCFIDWYEMWLDRSLLLENQLES